MHEGTFEGPIVPIGLRPPEHPKVGHKRQKKGEAPEAAGAKTYLHLSGEAPEGQAIEAPEVQAIEGEPPQAVVEVEAERGEDIDIFEEQAALEPLRDAPALQLARQPVGPLREAPALRLARQPLGALREAPALRLALRSQCCHLRRVRR